MGVPFLDLHAAVAEVRDELDAAWHRVMDRGWFIAGDELAAFEAEFAAYTGARFAIGVANGLDALTLTLRAWGVGPGDEVIVPGHTFIATWLAVSQVGAVPVPVEVDDATCNLDATAVQAAITPRTRVILPVHLYGQLADMTAIADVAKRHGVRVLEDAAQAHGAKRDGLAAGALGDAGLCSMTAISSRRPPQAQINASMANKRRNKTAHDILRCRCSSVPSGGDRLRLAGAKLVMNARQRALGANWPWKRTRLAPGAGTRAMTLA